MDKEITHRSFTLHTEEKWEQWPREKEKGHFLEEKETRVAL